jgi:hypothetical protein
MCRRLNSLPPVSVPHSVDLLKGRHVQHPELRLHAYDFIMARLSLPATVTHCADILKVFHQRRTMCRHLESLPPAPPPYSVDLLKGRQDPEVQLRAYDFMLMASCL